MADTEGDGRRPRIARTSSIFPRSRLYNAVVGEGRTFEQYGPPSRSPFAGVSVTATVPTPGSRRGRVAASVGQSNGETFIPYTPTASRNVQSMVPPGSEYVRAVPGGFIVRPKRGSRSAASDRGTTSADAAEGSFYRRAANAALQRNIERDSTRTIDAAPDGPSIIGPLDVSNVDPTQTFLFDRSGPIDPETGKRTGVLNARGVFGSADSLERQLPAGQTVTSGRHENIMTISAGVLWLRNLAARDRTAYNKLVVLLRNAGYPGLSANDEELPLNGYSQTVGVAFALAANDLAGANAGGDNRTLMEYLTDRGQGYADFLAQQEADQAAEEAYKPVDRQYQDPATLRAAAKEAAIAALGRRLTDEEEARLEASFRASEDAFYNQVDAAGEAETAFRGYSPDASGQIAEFIDSDEFETERQANMIGEYASSFMRLMGVQ